MSFEYFEDSIFALSFVLSRIDLSSFLRNGVGLKTFIYVFVCVCPVSH